MRVVPLRRSRTGRDRASRWVALSWKVLIVLLALFSSGSDARADEPVGRASSAVTLLEVEGTIDPLTARYLERELKGARAGDVVVVRLDTPGGLASSMRAMSQAILGSSAPVVVYVAPSGARAASAGMFVTIAAHVAAMAPGTAIGAAHPVGIGQEAESVEAEKATSDAAALARALAQARGRNAAWVEQAVRESVSSTAEEALDSNVIDLVAPDMEALLRELDGRTVTTTAGEVVLRTATAHVERRAMPLPEKILHTLADPNIAYLLLVLGLIGIAIEVYHPGLLVPGVTGAIALVLAWMAFGNLPTNWAGLLLLGLALVLFVAELHVEGFGVLGAAAIAAFILGSMVLYEPSGPDAPTMPEARVSPWLIGVMVAMIASLFLVVIRAVLRSRRVAVATGAQGLIGKIGVATSELAPEGTVKLNSESWRATSVAGPIHGGEAVRVTGVEGVTLRVTRQTPEDRGAPPP